ncbi:unnamed protein product [Calicophoron daubneyi]|uniref:Ig-like domain-containing protein n=1 Tax=Calicophoron daubneyi TaxID=300641 RepID=A0AAV2T7T5_CALDB
MLVFALLVVAFLLDAVAEDAGISVFPSQRVLSGTYLELSCKLKAKGFSTVWNKDGHDVAEGGNIFGKDIAHFRVEKKPDVVVLKTDSAKWSDRGNWSCYCGARLRKHIIIEIIVPPYVQTPKILQAIPVLQPAMKYAASTSDLLEIPQAAVSDQKGVHIPGTGVLKNPIDLSSNHPNSVREIVIECSTTCASLPHNLQWRYQNSTWAQPLHSYSNSLVSSDKVGHSSDNVCKDGLQSATSRVRLSCQLGPSNSAQNRNGLVGLNRIVCHVDYGNHHRQLDPVRPALVWLAEAQEECFNNGRQLASCVYVLCPGQPVPLFTFGERVALAISAALFALLCFLFCYLTQQRRRAKRKSNLAPGQRQEIELML